MESTLNLGPQRSKGDKNGCTTAKATGGANANFPHEKEPAGPSTTHTGNFVKALDSAVKNLQCRGDGLPKLRGG